MREMKSQRRMRAKIMLRPMASFCQREKWLRSDFLSSVCVYILLLYVEVNSRARCLAKRESPSHPLRTEYLNFLWKDCQRTEGAKSRPVRRIEQSCVVNAGCIARDETLLGYASH
jgi:hypothetical protein